jgi:hypothetical protein
MARWNRNCLPFRSIWIHPQFLVGSCYSIFSFICIFCRSLFVLLYFFFWPLCCLFYFDIRILITPLVSSNSSCTHLRLLRLVLCCMVHRIWFFMNDSCWRVVPHTSSKSHGTLGGIHINLLIYNKCKPCRHQTFVCWCLNQWNHLIVVLCDIIIPT